MPSLLPAPLRAELPSPATVLRHREKRFLPSASLRACSTTASEEPDGLAAPWLSALHDFPQESQARLPSASPALRAPPSLRPIAPVLSARVKLPRLQPAPTHY